MKTFVLMTKIARPDANLVEVACKLRDRTGDARTWLTEIKERCPEVKFISHFALLGTWDFMDIYEAPDEETAVKVSLITRSHGAHVVESWAAIPNEKIIEITRALQG
ncbi:MAG: GYD domain-containing protein [candidate division Zixibacteria bacterium]|nr:GYD domain-containing protein [candidate division Zixibacteria bacterium]